MAYPRHIWDQIKAITAKELCRALEKDGWKTDESRGAVRVYLSPTGRRVTVHWHPRSSYQPKLLNAMLDSIGWSEEDLKRLKIIK